MKKVGLGLLALATVYACSETANEMMGGILEDAGTMLQDAGQQMQDGGAHAQDRTAHPVNCSKARVQTTRNYDRDGALTLTITHRQEYAEIEVPDWRNVGVERCRQTSEDTWVTCPPSGDSSQVTCSGLLNQQGCDYFEGVYHVGNTVIVWCDSTYDYDYVDPDSNDFTTGNTYTSITAYY